MAVSGFSPVMPHPGPDASVFSQSHQRSLTGNDLHFAATFIYRISLFAGGPLNTKDSLQSLGPEKNSAPSNMPCAWRMAKPLATHLLAFSYHMLS
jgi:hypothetical protein